MAALDKEKWRERERERGGACGIVLGGGGVSERGERKEKRERCGESDGRGRNG